MVYAIGRHGKLLRVHKHVAHVYEPDEKLVVTSLHKGPTTRKSVVTALNIDNPKIEVIDYAKNFVRWEDRGAETPQPVRADAG